MLQNFFGCDVRLFPRSMCAKWAARKADPRLRRKNDNARAILGISVMTS